MWRVRAAHLLISLGAIFLFGACKERISREKLEVHLEDFGRWNTEKCALYSTKIRNEIDVLISMQSGGMYSDAYVRRYYRERKDFIWITRNGLDARADSLLSLCRQMDSWGFRLSSFAVSQIEEDLKRVRSLDFDEEHTINQVFARLEYNLTKSYLRILCGLRFGFVDPNYLFNRLEVADTSRAGAYTRLFDLEVERPDEQFVQQALEDARSFSFLKQIRESDCSDPLYRELLQKFRDKEYSVYGKDRMLVNLERLRWRQKRPSDHYVWVNLAAMELRAVDSSREENLVMRVGGGSRKHKTPLLTSELSLLQLNPYWNVPYSIVKNEIAGRHAQDTVYFNRNRMKIFHRESGREMNPEAVTASMLVSGDYAVRQERGVGNPLGRMIFRFDNDFAVYLHDTNAKSVFQNRNRAVSHGCIRLEKPLALAEFLIRDEQVMDRIRLSIDEQPQTKEGKAWKEGGDFVPMNSYTFQNPCPLFLTYYTLYPDLSGEWTVYPDPYQYDSVIEKKLKQV